MKYYKNKIIIGLAVIIFIAGASVLGWRESGQVYLKSGIGDYEDNHARALTVLEKGIERNPNLYTTHLYMAKALRKVAFNDLTAGNDAKRYLNKVTWHLRKALELRVDAVDFFELGLSYRMNGQVPTSLVSFNIAFFYSQDPSQLKTWKKNRRYQETVAREAFHDGRVGAAMMMVYNQLTGYAPYYKKKTAVTGLLADFFLSIPPDRWLTVDPEVARKRLKSVFDRLNPAGRLSVTSRLNSSRLVFLAEFLKNR